MSITLNWSNRNTVTLDSIKIYRGTARNSINTLIDTIAGNLTTYNDTTAGDDTLYFYRIDGVSGTFVSSSDILLMRNVTNIGPGPTTILRGDWEFGLLGEVAASLLPTWPQVKAAAGITGSQPPVTPTSWAKWIIGGRIVFIPNNLLGYGMSAAVIPTNPSLAAGKLFVTAGGDRIVNGCKITIGGYNFLARLPYASTLVTTEQNPNNDITANTSTNVIINPGSTFTKSELMAFIKTILNGADMLTVSDHIRFHDYALINFINQNFFTNTFVESATKVITLQATAGQWVDSMMLSTNILSAGVILPIMELLPAS